LIRKINNLLGLGCPQQPGPISIQIFQVEGHQAFRHFFFQQLFAAWSTGLVSTRHTLVDLPHRFSPERAHHFLSPFAVQLTLHPHRTEQWENPPKSFTCSADLTACYCLMEFPSGGWY